MSNHVEQTLVPMEPTTRPGKGCSCGWHSHTQTFEEHVAEVSDGPEKWVPEAIAEQEAYLERIRMEREVKEMGDLSETEKWWIGNDDADPLEAETTEATVGPLVELKSACSNCGSTAPHHVAYVREHGVCVS